MSGVLERLATWVDDTEWAQARLQGDRHTQMIMSSTVPILVEQMRDMDLSDQPTYKGRKLMPLGEARRSVDVGGVRCTRMIYLGDDGNVYIEGPQRRMNTTVIGIHPYGIKDAAGWDGVWLRDVADLVATYTI